MSLCKKMGLTSSDILKLSLGQLGESPVKDATASLDLLLALSNLKTAMIEEEWLTVWGLFQLMTPKEDQLVQRSARESIEDLYKLPEVGSDVYRQDPTCTGRIRRVLGGSDVYRETDGKRVIRYQRVNLLLETWQSLVVVLPPSLRAFRAVQYIH